MNWSEVTSLLSAQPVRVASGFYHTNTVLTHADALVVARKRIHSTDFVDMEPRQLDENEALAAAASVGVRVPKVLYNDDDVAIHSHIPGEPVFTWEGQPAIYSRMCFDVAETMIRLESVKRVAFTRWGTSNPWRTSRRSRDVLVGIVHWIETVRQSADSVTEALLAEFGLPSSGMAGLVDDADRARDREPQFCHGDIQPTNILFDGARFSYLDWELAAWVDPLWDVALHVQRSCYTEDQLAEFWSHRVSGSSRLTARDRIDLDRYLRVECAKSLVFDTFRYVERYRTGTTTGWEAPYFSRKLRFAAPYLSVPLYSTEEIDVLFQKSVVQHAY